MDSKGRMDEDEYLTQENWDAIAVDSSSSFSRKILKTNEWCCPFCTFSFRFHATKFPFTP